MAVVVNPGLNRSDDLEVIVSDYTQALIEKLNSDLASLPYLLFSLPVPGMSECFDATSQVYPLYRATESLPPGFAVLQSHRGTEERQQDTYLHSSIGGE
ncbi:hypothetical protein QTP70_001964 [Hemibagrus guttatus]|uniref:Uncharacterized protein n=1 Tax=Hemibagrus guttatus TaxID=175788 RepID=A0AAE0QX58_9TELE|nr:hypothetical protein QTP70_001964 [Hemibagrus guttatus]